MSGCASTAQRFRDEDTVPLTVVNRTTESLCFLYVSPRGRDVWSDDALSGTVEPQRRGALRLPPGVWDLRTENCQHEATGILRDARITRGTTLLLQ